ncbi:MAG: hypothetical protein ACD_5C00255G0002 [uncultured bacterium]|nr:MAG: hypothetical protein ACD_5C00255G0002 [uncultured bacterium]
MKIVTAAIIKKKGKYLVAKRKAGGVVGGKWEFPGGKLEKNETLWQGLARELDEELDIKIKEGEFFDEYVLHYKNGSIKLYAYTVNNYSGKIKLREHEKIRWVTPNELHCINFTGNDKPIVAKITEELKNDHQRSLVKRKLLTYG